MKSMNNFVTAIRYVFFQDPVKFPATPCVFQPICLNLSFLLAALIRTFNVCRGLVLDTFQVTKDQITFANTSMIFLLEEIVV